MNQRSLLVVFAVFSLIGVGAASAGPINITSASVGGAPTGVFYDNLDWVKNVTTPQYNATTGVEITLFPDAQAVQGTTGIYAAPYLYNGNGTVFGQAADGPDTSVYLTTGSTDAQHGAKVTVKFGVTQTYMGLLWGSVDNYNTLTFYLKGVEQRSFTGADVTKTATGDQGVNGTFYVNFAGGPFDEVQAVSSVKAFEFDNIALERVPDGGATVALLGAALVGLGMLRRRLRG
jgi:hypothetical protein